MKRFLGFLGAWWKGVLQGMLEGIVVCIPISIAVAAIACKCTKDETTEET